MMGGGIVFANVGSQPCLLVGRPRVELVGTHGKALDVQESDFRGGSPPPGVTLEPAVVEGRVRAPRLAELVREQGTVGGTGFAPIFPRHSDRKGRRIQLPSSLRQPEREILAVSWSVRSARVASRH